MNHDDQIKAEIMARVKTVRGIRVVFTLPVIGTLVLFALLTWIDLIVSVHDIMKNTMSHATWSDCFSYVFSSFFHSRAIVQILATLVMLGGIALCVRLARKVKVMQIFSRIQPFRRTA